MSIYIGIGGWVFEAWRGTFYPKGHPQKRELEYASSRLTGIEVNGTYYGSKSRKASESGMTKRPRVSSSP